MALQITLGIAWLRSRVFCLRNTWLSSGQQLYVGHHGLALGQRSSLIKKNCGDAASPLQRGGVLDKNAAQTGLARSHHDRHGPGQTKRAWTRNNQHGRGRHNSSWPRTRHAPTNRGGRRDHKHKRNKHRRHAIGHALNGRTTCLRVLHQTRNATERSVAPSCRGAHMQHATEAHCSSTHALAQSSAHRKRLTRHHGLVQVSLANFNHAVNGNASAWTHHDYVCGANVLRLNELALARRANALGFFRLQFQQFAHRRARALGGLGLKPMSKRNDRK